MPKVEISMSEEQKKEWQNYAKVKGLKTAANLIRFAVVQYMTRYPLKSQGCTASSESSEK